MGDDWAVEEFFAVEFGEAFDGDLRDAGDGESGESVVPLSGFHVGVQCEEDGGLGVVEDEIDGVCDGDGPAEFAGMAIDGSELLLGEDCGDVVEVGGPRAGVSGIGFAEEVKVSGIDGGGDFGCGQIGEIGNFSCACEGLDVCGLQIDEEHIFGGGEDGKQSGVEELRGCEVREWHFMNGIECS